MTLTRPRPRQLHPVVFRIGQVKRHAHDLLQVQHFLPIVAIAHTARNRTALGKNCIEEFRTQPRDRILHLNDEGLCLIVRLHVGRGQTRELRLAIHDTMRCVLHIKDAAAVLLQYVQRGTAKIRRAVGRQLLPNRIQRVVAAVRKNARRHAAMDALKDVLKARAVAQHFSVVERSKPAVGQHHEDVADGIVEEMKDLTPLMIDDIH